MAVTSDNSHALGNANLRLCRLCTWPGYTGHGFTLGNASDSPQIIGIVESNSPAAAGGLRILDIILAVNNNDMSNATSRDLRKVIRYAQDSNDRIELLVVEKHIYELLKRRKISFDRRFAKTLETPTAMPRDYKNFPKNTPRICRVCLNKPDESFGFEVVTGDNNIGAFIQDVITNTPASLATLRKSDRIIEIDDEFVDDKLFSDITAKIKNAKSKCVVKLYVVDTHTYKYFQENHISLHSTQKQTSSSAKKSSTNSYINQSNHDNKSPESITLRSSDYTKSRTSDSSDLQSIFEEDIRLYTITRADVTDTAPVGLKDDDHLIEIDGQNVENLGDDQIKKYISGKHSQSLQLLVVNTATYYYYKRKKKRIHSGLPSVQIMAQKDESDDDQNSNESSSDESDNDNDSVVASDTCDDSDRDCHHDQSNSSVPKTQVRNTHYSTSNVIKSSTSSVQVCRGDLIEQNTDVIVVCSSSQYLFDSICKAGGVSVLTAYNTKLNKNSNDSLIAVQANGQLASKRIYFLPWRANSDTSILCASIEQFVSDAVENAVQEKYKSIAFPAIGCGQFGCSISLVAEAMIGEAHRKSLLHDIRISFIIQPERKDIYNEFKNQINLIERQPSTDKSSTISAIVGKGVIEVEKGDITKQKVDVIIASLSSGILLKTILKAAGKTVQTAYDVELENHPNSTLIITPAGSLSCKRIFFVTWEPDNNKQILQQSLIDLMSTVVQNAKSHNFSSIAFPAIGCGQHGCSVDVVVETMVLEMKRHLVKRNLPWTVKFIVQPDQENVYNEFCTQVLNTQDGLHEAETYKLPSTWEKSTEAKIRFVLSTTSKEYKSIVTNFDQAMKDKYTQIIRIERIQNERWYMQYLAHSKDFEKRLKMDSERRLYHGCPEVASNLIIEDGFNRSFAGVNGTLYGVGVYFSSDAAYSHIYTALNTNGERCMFVARVLVGKTVLGNSSMKTRPLGFDSTTDSKHIFVTYHDAQAFAEYLMTYK